MFCGNCGSEIEDDVAFCPNCGAQVQREETTSPQSMPSPPKKKGHGPLIVVLIVLAVLLVGGGVGGYLYLSNPKSREEHEKMEVAEKENSKEEEKQGETEEENSGQEKPEQEEPEQEEPVATQPKTTVEHEYTVVNQRMTWEEAKTYCENQGGYLAVVTSQEEYDIVVQKATESGLSVLWLGGMRGSTDGFSWINDDTFSYTAWAANEPNNDGGTENYLDMMYVGGIWQWYDVPNDLSPYYGADKVGFVMEKEVERPVK